MNSETKKVSLRGKTYLVILKQTKFLSTTGIKMVITKFIDEQAFYAYECDEEIPLELEMTINDIQSFIDLEPIDAPSTPENKSIVSDDLRKQAEELSRSKMKRKLKVGKDEKDEKLPVTKTKEIKIKSKEESFADLYFGGNVPVSFRVSKSSISKLGYNEECQVVVSYNKETSVDALGNIACVNVPSKSGKEYSVVGASIFYNDEIDYVSFALCCRKVNHHHKGKSVAFPLIKEADSLMIRRIMERELTSLMEVVIVE